MTRSEAAKQVKAYGGYLQGAVTQQTDFVILGDKRRGISAKQHKAEQLMSQGQDIQILIEDDFYGLFRYQGKWTSKRVCKVVLLTYSFHILLYRNNNRLQCIRLFIGSNAPVLSLILYTPTTGVIVIEVACSSKLFATRRGKFPRPLKSVL